MSEDEKWVKVEREFDAPINRIWEMWTDPELFKTWYGPKGMLVPVAEMDLRVGGTRKVCMEMAAANPAMKMWFTGVYKEITPPHRLVYTESMCDEQGNLIPPKSMGMPDDFPDITEIIVELNGSGDKTRMTMTHIGVKAGTAGAGGWSQAFDKLAELLKI